MGRKVVPHDSKSDLPLLNLPGEGCGTTKYFMPAMLTTDWASSTRGIADFPVPEAKLCLFLPPVLPVGVRVTEGTLLALVEAVEPKADVIVVEL